MTRQSTTGYVVQHGMSPISLKTKMPDTISRSSTKAKYRAMANATSEVIWIHNMLKFISIAISSVVLHYDNQAALHIVATLIFHESIKHIEVDYHCIHKKIVSGDIVTCCTPTWNNLPISSLKHWVNNSFTIFFAS